MVPIDDFMRIPYIRTYIHTSIILTNFGNNGEPDIAITGTIGKFSGIFCGDNANGGTAGGSGVDDGSDSCAFEVGKPSGSIPLSSSDEPFPDEVENAFFGMNWIYRLFF